MDRSAAFDPVDVAVTTLATFAWTAAPDVVSSRSHRRLARAGILALFGTAIGVKTALADPDGDLARLREMRQAAKTDDSARIAEISAEQDAVDAEHRRRLDNAMGSIPRHWRAPALAALAVGGIGLTIGSIALQQKIDDAVAAWFADRGMAHPYTATGACWAALTAAILPLLPD